MQCTELTVVQVKDRKDLSTLGRVCKSLYPLVTEHLYRCVVLGPKTPGPFDEDYDDAYGDDYKDYSTMWLESIAMVRRLAADPNPDQTYAVREVEVVSFERDDKGAGDIKAELEKEDALPGFVSVLPNLRVFRSVPLRGK
jgi:hypothetical protein